MRKFLFSLLFLALNIFHLRAYDAYIDGIYYDFNQSAQIAIVTNETGKYDAYSYYGDIYLPNRISYNGIEYIVSAIGQSAFQGCEINSIQIPESVISIGKSAFYGCTQLKEIILPPKTHTIGEQAFFRCEKLEHIEIGEELSIIEPSVFDRCKSLKQIILPNSIKKINAAAFYGSGIENITLPDSIDLIDWQVFSYCTNLETICLPKNLEEIGFKAFEGCTNLKSIVFTDKLKRISNEAFSGCSNIESLVLPNSLSSVNTGAFKNCSSLCKIFLGSGLRYLGKSCFSGCTKLESVYCYSDVVPNSEASAFEGCFVNYAQLYVKKNLLQDYKSTQPWNSFGKIIAMDENLLDIDSSVIHKETKKSIYDINGKIINQPRGIGIHNNKKVLF